MALREALPVNCFDVVARPGGERISIRLGALPLSKNQETPARSSGKLRPASFPVKERTFTMSTRLCFSLPLLGALTAILSGCSGNSSTPVTMAYRQIGFCDTYTTAGGTRAAKPDEAFVVYKIETIDNEKRSAPFAFLPARLYVDPAEWGAEKTPWKSRPGDAQDWFYRRDRRRYISVDASFAQAIGVHGLASAMISPSSKTDIGGYAILEVPVPQGKPLEPLIFKLSYEPQEGDGDAIPADPPIILNVASSAEASFPHPANCAELKYDKPGT